MENSNEKKSLFFRLIIATAIIIPLAISFSYAYFLAEVSGDRTEATATTASDFIFDFITDSQNGYINASDVVPISDANVNTQAEATTFTVQNGTNPYPVKYSFYLTDIVIDDALKISDFKWKLTDEDRGLDIVSGSFSEYTSGDLLLMSNLIIDSDSEANYKLRIWVSETNTDQSALINKSFSGRVKVEAEFWQSSFFSEYQMVEYIQNPSTAYIDTRYLARSGLEAFGNVLYPSVPANGVLMGTRTGNNNRIHLVQTSSSKWSVGYGSNFASTTTVSANTLYFFHSRLYAGSQLLEINSVKVYSGTNASSFNQINYMIIFAGRNGTSVESNSVGKLYSLYLYLDGSMVKAYIPCYRLSDNVAGLYEIISGSFYSSANSVALVAGPDLT